MAPFLNGAGFTEGAYRIADGTVRYSTRDDELFRLKPGEQLKPNGKNKTVPTATGVGPYRAGPPGAYFPASSADTARE